MRGCGRFAAAVLICRFGEDFNVPTACSTDVWYAAAAISLSWAAGV
jgi:hypothetical protein